MVQLTATVSVGSHPVFITAAFRKIRYNFLVLCRSCFLINNFCSSVKWTLVYIYTSQLIITLLELLFLWYLAHILLWQILLCDACHFLDLYIIIAESVVCHYPSLSNLVLVYGLQVYFLWFQLGLRLRFMSSTSIPFTLYLYYNHPTLLGIYMLLHTI